MRLTFSSEVRAFPKDFTHNKLPVVLSPLSQNRTVFRVGGWRPYCIVKWCWTAVRVCNSHWTCSCGVNILTELAEGHQLAHVHKPGMKKPSVFLSNDINWIRVWHLVSETYIFYFGYLSSGHSVVICSYNPYVVNKSIHQFPPHL
jgi:hypothetical protein